MKRSPLRRSITRLAPVAARKRDAKRAKTAWRREYLGADNRCEIAPVLLRSGYDRAEWWGRYCTGLATELHERKKRSRGGSTTDPENLCRTCRSCHEFTEAYPLTAEALGLLVYSWDDPTDSWWMNAPSSAHRPVRDANPPGVVADRVPSLPGDPDGGQLLAELEEC